MAPPPTKYDVFLSFRGQDTRDNFTSHLFAELGRKNIHTFIDHKLEIGDEISSELCKAIEESIIYVIIFSENYATSSWCLNELVKILDCKKRYQRQVIPVFYKVDPSSVRHQKHSFADAFVKLEKRYPDKVTQSWKDALAEAAEISGWDSNTTSPESMLVDEIVKDILRKLDRSLSSDDEGMVGIDKHIAQIQSLLDLESETVRIIGIWGMGGIGKTTLARALYHKLGTCFSSRSLIVNAQQEIERDGTQGLRKKYLSELLDEGNTSNGLHFSDERLKRVKVLLILDDVKNLSQIQELIGGRRKFGQGSRIIVTSRDMQVLRNAEVDGIYEVKEMNYQDSLQLFSLNAFKPNCSIQVNEHLVKKILEYAKGIPLALKVLGTLLCGRGEKAWESELQKLEKLPDVEIYKVLKLSYDGLDDEQQDIFLDIVCFCASGIVDGVVEMLDACGFSVDIGVDVLKDRGLIYTLKDYTIVNFIKGIGYSLNNGIRVHDLMLEMGIEIVRRQCINDPGKRSRLWNHEEIYHVLRRNKGTDAVQCIFLDIGRIKSVELHPNVFKSMPNLRMLYFHIKGWFLKKAQSNVNLPSFLESLPDGLKFLHWDQFPLRSLPLDFCPENLVQLDMRHSCLEQFWEDNQELPNLKKLDLSYSHNLIGMPDLSNFPNIEEIILCGCASLIQLYSSSFLAKLKSLWLRGCVELRSLSLHHLVGLEELSLHECSRLEIIPSSIGRLTKLCKLDLICCESLETLPSSIFKLKLTELDLTGCSKFKTFPEISKPAENFVGITLDQTAIQVLLSSFHHLMGLEELSLHECSRLEIIQSSIERLTKLCKLDLICCESLETLPSSIFKLKLTELDLTGCSKFKTFPEILEPAENFACIKLDQTAIQVLPSSLHHLVGLEELSLHECSRLEIIPSSIGRLTKLCKLDLICCESLETLPSSIFKLKLKELDLTGCSKFKTFPEISEPVENFVCIKLDRTAIQVLPSSLHRLVGLEELSLHECSRLEIIPSSIGRLTKLCKLDLICCESLETLPSSIFKLKLKELDLTGCTKFKTFPEILEPVENFVCIKLDRTAIQVLPSSLHRLVGLEELSLHECSRLEIIPSSIGRLTKLCKLDLICCESLETLPSSIFKLKLKELDLTGCSKFKTFPEISEPTENFVCIKLYRTAIQVLPSSLHRLVGLEELSLHECSRLEIIPSSIGKLTKLCKLDVAWCRSLKTLPSNIFELKMTSLDLIGCSMLKTLPEILEPAESFAHNKLTEKSIKELPSSLECLVGLEELSLGCLEIIPSSIGRFAKLCNLNLICCHSLETIPSSIFKLKLTRLSLYGCSMLKTFPEILEPAESFAHINLTGTSIKELPSSLDCLVGLKTMCLARCHDLESLPNSISNLKLLSELDCSGCGKLTEIPNDIGRLSSLRRLSLQDTGILNLPESIAHLSSLESLNVSRCRNLECIPQLPPFLKKLLALNCPSIGRVMPNSRFILPSDSRKGTIEFYFTNNEEQDPKCS